MITADSDPVLHELLHEPVNRYQLPYYVTRYHDDTMAHWPGLKGDVGKMSYKGNLIQWDAKAVGYRGINVLSYSDPVTEHFVQLRWAGIDIDAKDNPDRFCGYGVDARALEPDSLINRVCRVIPAAMVRLSKSGKGVHVILRLDPKCYPTVSYDQAKQLARGMVAGPKVALQAAGITVCVTGLPNLWLWSEGGKQKTVQEGTTVELPGAWSECGAPKCYGNTAQQDREIPLDNFKGTPAAILVKLLDAGLIRDAGFGRCCVYHKAQINVGEFLRKTGIKVTTKSQCRPEHAHEVNGYLELGEDGSLKLFSNADNGVILALYSL